MLACISELSRWAMTMVARSLAKRLMALRMRCSVPASMAAVESSNTITAGRRIRLRAIDSRCRWPPQQRHATLADHGAVLLPAGR